MSASNEWEEWHLTPNGWVEGTEKTDFARTERPTPEDRVASYTYTEHLSSVFSKLEVTWEQDWSGPADIVSALLKQFGNYPESVERRLSRHGKS